MCNLKLSGDEDLVRLYISGDERAFDELYIRYAPKLKRLIYFYLGDSDAADDVFHEVFIRVIKHAGKFNMNMVFSSWIYRIAVNCSKSYIGAKKKSEVMLEKVKYRVRAEGFELQTPESEVLNQQDVDGFNSAVNSLKEKFRNVFILRFDHRLKYSEISEILKCSERTAKWRMEKAVGHIAQYLKENKII